MTIDKKTNKYMGNFHVEIFFKGGVLRGMYNHIQISKDKIIISDDCDDSEVAIDLVTKIQTKQQYIPGWTESGVFYLWEEKTIWEEEKITNEKPKKTLESHSKQFINGLIGLKERVDRLEHQLIESNIISKSNRVIPVIDADEFANSPNMNLNV